MFRENKSFSSHIFFRKRIWWHVLFWVIATIYLMLAFRGRSDTLPGLLKTTLLYLPAHIFFVYVLLYFLIPKFLLKREFLIFLCCFVPAIIISALYIRFIDVYVFSSVEKITDKRIFFRTIFATFNLCGIAVAIKLVKYWFREREAKQQAEKENLISQLQLLKSQVHPHFLFNTLNNLYSLTLEKSDKAPLVVLKLAALLRYMLYECNTNEIALEKEIEMMNNFIELQKIRYGKRLDLSINYSGQWMGKKIAPLLLLPFLENCFKHGASEQIDQCWINLYLHEENNILYTKFINSHIKTNMQTNHKGIGIINVQKRLDLLYKNGYILKTTPTEDAYVVSLELQLESLNHDEQTLRS